MTRRLLALSLAALAVACGEPANGARDAETEDAARGLCDAVDLAGAGDVAGAEAAFQDRVHRFLHDLADRLSTFDRERAGALLQAKQRVEAALADDASAGLVHASMAALYRELEEAADAAGAVAPPCPEAQAA